MLQFNLWKVLLGELYLLFQKLKFLQPWTMIGEKELSLDIAVLLKKGPSFGWMVVWMLIFRLLIQNFLKKVDTSWCSLVCVSCNRLLAKYAALVLEVIDKSWMLIVFIYRNCCWQVITSSKIFLLTVLLFAQDDELQVKVNKLSSTKTQLPYDYYFLDYCKPSKTMNSAENLGEVLRGDRIENSVYTVSTQFLACLVNNALLLTISFNSWT